jgi:Tol biopolymer transport system component/DNA-binding winged helix-turn-helix (wHTH) protein
MEPGKELPIYRFGDVVVDVGRMAVSRGGTPLDIEPKAFDVLRFLLEHRERLVTKDELLDAVWHDTFVTPNVLTRIVAQLRKALGDDAQEARYIETVPKRGYRFIVPVTVAGPPVAAAIAAPAPVLTDTPVTAPRPRRGGAIAAMIVAAVIAGFGLWSRPGGPDEAGPAGSSDSLVTVPRRVTISAGNNTSPTLSPDGSAIAYVSDRTGALEIYVVALAPGSREVALTSDGGQNTFPAWSPDGRWIAYSSRSRGGVWVVPATGGAATQIAEEGSQPAWSPDGESIVFSSTQGAMAGQSVIKIVPRVGGAQRELTRLGAPPGGHRGPTWSRNGRFIAFVSANGFVDRGAWIVNADGGEPRKVTIDVGDEIAQAGDLQFGPEDRGLLLTGEHGGVLGLYRIPFDPADGKATGKPSLVLPAQQGIFAGISVSREGMLAYAVQTADNNLWAIDLVADGSAGEPLRLTSDTVRAGHPDYSGDGARVVFNQTGIGVQNAVWMMNEDGSDRAPLTREWPAAAPSWDRSGNRVMVQAAPKDEPLSLWWVDVDSRRTTRIPVATGNDIRNARVSPDGKSIAYWSPDKNGGLNVWTQSVDGGPPRRITSDPEAVNFPAWSPDGRWLAVEIKRGEVTHVGVVSKDGGPIERLTNRSGQSWPHSWAPDGDQIAFAGEANGVWNVWTVSRRTRQTRQLTHFDSASGYVRYPAWSPRGNRIVFERQITEASIWTAGLAESSQPDLR